MGHTPDVRLLCNMRLYLCEKTTYGIDNIIFQDRKNTKINDTEFKNKSRRVTMANTLLYCYIQVVAHIKMNRHEKLINVGTNIYF